MSLLVQFVCAIAECLCWYGLCVLLFDVLCWYGLYVLSLNVPFVCDVLSVLSRCSLGVFVLIVNCVCYGFCLFVLNVIC